MDREVRDGELRSALDSRQVELILQITDQPKCALRSNARPMHCEGSIPVRMVRCRLSPLGNCDAEDVVPFRMPANFVHNRFLQFSARPLLLGHCCSCARVLRSPRSDDGHRVESPGSTPSSIMIVIRRGSSSWERQVYPS